MAADQPGGKALDKTSTPQPYLKLKARECLGDEAKGTSSWSILKDLKMSLVDGGVSILKQGFSKLTGAFSSSDLPKQEASPPTPAKSIMQSDVPTVGMSTGATGGHVVAEPSAGAVDHSHEETAAFGFDWLDNLLEELDTSKPAPDQFLGPGVLPDEATGTVHSNTNGNDAGDEGVLFPGV